MTLFDQLSEYDWELLKQQLHDADSAMTVINRILEGHPRSAYGGLDHTAPIHCKIIGQQIGEIRKHVLAQDWASSDAPCPLNSITGCEKRRDRPDK